MVTQELILCRLALVFATNARPLRVVLILLASATSSLYYPVGACSHRSYGWLTNIDRALPLQTAQPMHELREHPPSTVLLMWLVTSSPKCGAFVCGVVQT